MHPLPHPLPEYREREKAIVRLCFDSLPHARAHQPLLGPIVKHMTTDAAAVDRLRRACAVVAVDAGVVRVELFVAHVGAVHVGREDVGSGSFGGGDGVAERIVLAALQRALVTIDTSHVAMPAMIETRIREPMSRRRGDAGWFGVDLPGVALLLHGDVVTLAAARVHAPGEIRGEQRLAR